MKNRNTWKRSRCLTSEDLRDIQNGTGGLSPTLDERRERDLARAYLRLTGNDVPISAYQPSDIPESIKSILLRSEMNDALGEIERQWTPGLSRA